MPHPSNKPSSPLQGNIQQTFLPLQGNIQRTFLPLQGNIQQTFLPLQGELEGVLNKETKYSLGFAAFTKAERRLKEPLITYNHDKERNSKVYSTANRLYSVCHPNGTRSNQLYGL